MWRFSSAWFAFGSGSQHGLCGRQEMRGSFEVAQFWKFQLIQTLVPMFSVSLLLSTWLKTHDLSRFKVGKDRSGAVDRAASLHLRVPGGRVRLVFAGCATVSRPFVNPPFHQTGPEAAVQTEEEEEGKEFLLENLHLFFAERPLPDEAGALPSMQSQDTSQVRLLRYL